MWSSIDASSVGPTWLLCEGVWEDGTRWFSCSLILLLVGLTDDDDDDVGIGSSWQLE